TTARLVLRPFTPADGPDVERLAGAREVADTTLHVPHPYPPGAGAAWSMRLEGMHRGAYLRWGRFEDVAVYAILADEWAAPASPP
ncbi:MAG: hypothetical protein ACJ8AO_04265, partial [Gemmatimonadaceae bacterium]